MTDILTSGNLEQINQRFAMARAELVAVEQKIMAARQDLQAIRAAVRATSEKVEEAQRRAERVDAASNAAEVKARKLLADAHAQAKAIADHAYEQAQGLIAAAQERIDQAHTHIFRP